MNKKMMYYKPPPLPRSTSKQQISSKPLKPKPEWNMDFGDSDKYKLSQAEMIQKKAALQSSNMQSAKELLAQRRRKLEEGVIDEETRKIYETALISKRIDPNPSIRRNLSQMIHYQRDMLSQSQRSTSKRKSVQQTSVEEELKNTKEFIRKMERASKAKDVIRAVKILQQKPKSFQSSRISNSQVDVGQVKKLTPLQNIEETIKFMEQKLFKSKIPRSSQQSLPTITVQRQTEDSQHDLPSSIVDTKARNFNNQNQSLEISYVPKRDYKLNSNDSPIKDHGNDQEDWLNTIRRMNNLIKSKQRKQQLQIDKHYESFMAQPTKKMSNQEDLGYVKQQLVYEYSSYEDQNKNTMNIPTDRRIEEEVDFSLTIYNQNSLRIDTDQFFQTISGNFKPLKENKNSGTIKSLSSATLEGSRLTTFDRPLVQQVEPNEDQGGKSYFQEPSLSFQQIHFTNQIVKSINTKKTANLSSNVKPNPEAQRIKRLLDDTKKNLDNVILTKLQVPVSTCGQSLGISLKKLTR